MRTYRKNFRNQKPQQQAKQQDYLLVIDATDTEDKRIYKIRASSEQLRSELQNSLKPRLFDPSRDDRGPEVKIMLTYGLREGTWFPQTEGSYLIELLPDRPEKFKHVSLGFGSVSSPQSTKAAIHRVLLDILAALGQDLLPYLRCVKRPCVFCKDHPDAPGGSTVEIDMNTLPTPCEPNKVARFYM